VSPADDLTIVAFEGESEARTIWPFQQVNSGASEYQRQFDRIVPNALDCREMKLSPCPFSRCEYRADLTTVQRAADIWLQVRDTY
jgi:hypothetical protein